MEFIQGILLRYLKDGIEVGDVEPAIINRSITALEKISLFEPDRTSTENWDQCKKYCEDLLTVFGNFESTLESCAIIKDILQLLVYLSRKYHRDDYFKISHYKDSLLRVVVDLSASNFRRSGEPFKVTNKMFSQLFGSRFSDYVSRDSARVVSAGILNALLGHDWWNVQDTESYYRDKVVLILMKNLVRGNEKSAMAKVILKECASLRMGSAISQVLKPCLMNESIGIPTLFDDEETLYDTIVELFVVNKWLTACTVTIIRNNLNERNSSRREIALIAAFNLFTRTVPGKDLDDLWEYFTLQFFRPDIRELSAFDARILCKYSPALLNGALFDPISSKWLDGIIEIITGGIYEQKKFLEIFVDAEKSGRNFFSIQEHRSKIEPLIRLGSKQLDHGVKEFFLRSLCEVYLDHVKNGFLPAAANLAPFILNPFTSGAANPEDWALARVLIRILTSGREHGERMLSSVLLNVFCTAQLDDSMTVALREAYRYCPDVGRIWEEFLGLRDTSQESLNRFSNRLLCEMSPLSGTGNINYTTAIRFILKKAIQEDTFRTKLSTIMSFETSINHKEFAKKYIKLPKRIVKDSEEFKDRFLSTVEPPVDNAMMTILLEFINEKMTAGNDSNEGLRGDSPLGNRWLRDNEDKLMPYSITLDLLVYTLYEAIVRSPHLATQNPDTLKVLLKLLSNSHGHGFACTLALRTIYAALNCGCNDEELQSPRHVQWTAQELGRIRGSCLELTSSAVDSVWSGEEMSTETYTFTRAVFKRIIRIMGMGCIGHPDDLNFLVQRAEETLDSNEDPAREISVAILGFIAAEKRLLPALKSDLLNSAGKIALRLMENVNVDISCVEQHMDCEWVGKEKLPPKLRLLVEEYRMVGRIVRFCGPTSQSSALSFLVIGDFFSRIIPEKQQEYARSFLENSATDAAQNLFCTASAGILRKESACAVLTMLDSGWFGVAALMNFILTLAHIAMDPMPEVRDTFTRKLNHGLCSISDWSDDSGSSKGKLPPVLAALIPLTCLYRADFCRDMDLKERYDDDVLTTFKHLLVYVRSQRRYRHRLQNHAVPQDGSPSPTIFWERPNLFPEVVLCWLVPILAKLDILDWYTSYEQLANMEEMQIMIVKLIYNCVELVLLASIDVRAGDYCLALSFGILQDLPKHIVRFIKAESREETERHVLLCWVLKYALEGQRARRGKEPKNKHPLNMIFKRWPLFYDIRVEQLYGSELYIRADRNFKTLFERMKEMSFPVSVSLFKEFSPYNDGCDDEQIFLRSGSRSTGLFSPEPHGLVAGTSRRSGNVELASPPEQHGSVSSWPRQSVVTEVGSQDTVLLARHPEWHVSASSSSGQSIRSQDTVQLARHPERHGSVSSSSRHSIRSQDAVLVTRHPEPQRSTSISPRLFSSSEESVESTNSRKRDSLQTGSTSVATKRTRRK